MWTLSAPAQTSLPEDIPLRLLNNAVEKSILEMFSVRAGTVPDELPPLVVLAKEDPDEILGGEI